MRKRVIDIHALTFDEELMCSLGQNKNQRSRGALAYVLLWSAAEDWGGYEPNYKTFSKLLGFLDFTPREVEKFVGILVNRRKVIPFHSETGREIHWLVNFRKHQPLNNPSLPQLPLPEWITYLVKKFPSGKQFAEYYLVRSRLPENYQDISSSLPEAEIAADGSLLVGSLNRPRNRNRNGNRNRNKTYKSGGPEIGPPDIEVTSCASGAPSQENRTQPTTAEKEELARLCSSIQIHFGIHDYSPTNPQKWKSRFHPIRFVQTCIHQDIPVDVTLKVLRSMNRQRDRIMNPWAWLVDVMKKEVASYNYELELEEHEKRKQWFSSPGDIFGGIRS